MTLVVLDRTPKQKLLSTSEELSLRSMIFSNQSVSSKVANESRLKDMCVCTFPQKTVSGVTFVSGPPLRLLVCLSNGIGATTRHPGAVHFWNWVPSEWAWRYGGCFYLSRKTARASSVPLRMPCISYDAQDDRLLWEENSQSSEGKLLWKVRSLRITFVAAKSSDTVCVGAATTIGLHASKLRRIFCTKAGVWLWRVDGSLLLWSRDAGKCASGPQQVIGCSVHLHTGRVLAVDASLRVFECESRGEEGPSCTVHASLVCTLRPSPQTWLKLAGPQIDIAADRLALYVAGGGGCKVFDLYRGIELRNFPNPKGLTAGLSSLGARMALFIGPALWILQPPALPALLSAVAAPMGSESIQIRLATLERARAVAESEGYTTLAGELTLSMFKLHDRFDKQQLPQALTRLKTNLPTLALPLALLPPNRIDDPVVRELLEETFVPISTPAESSQSLFDEVSADVGENSLQIEEDQSLMEWWNRGPFAAACRGTKARQFLDQVRDVLDLSQADASTTSGPATLLPPEFCVDIDASPEWVRHVERSVGLPSLRTPDDVAALPSPGQLLALAGKDGCGVALLQGVSSEYRRRCSVSAREVSRPLARGTEAKTAFEVLCRMYLLVHPEVVVGFVEWVSAHMCAISGRIVAGPSHSARIVRRRVATMALNVLPCGLGCSDVLARSFALAQLHELADNHDMAVMLCLRAGATEKAWRILERMATTTPSTPKTTRGAALVSRQMCMRVLSRLLADAVAAKSLPAAVVRTLFEVSAKCAVCCGMAPVLSELKSFVTARQSKSPDLTFASMAPFLRAVSKTRGQDSPSLN